MYNGPHIATDGLVLYLDAANIKSYPGSGTTWNDLSGNNFNFTLDGSGITWNSRGTFSLADGGASFNGIITQSTTCTFQFWIKTTDVQALFWDGQDGNYYLGAYRVGLKEYYGNCGTPDFTLDTIDRPNIYDHLIDGNWHMVEFKNVNLSTWTVNEFNQYSSFTFGNGEIAAILLYNRNLTQNESVQNYLSLKSRFNL